MQIIRTVPLGLIALIGCAGHPPLPATKLSDWVHAPPEEVRTAAAAAFTARGYYAYLGNPETVVASKSESTFWTRPALIAGIAMVPVLIVTWPVVAIFDTSLYREATMWWPMAAFSWHTSTYRHTQFCLKTKPDEQGGTWITVEVISSEKVAQNHASQVIEELLALEPPVKEHP